MQKKPSELKLPASIAPLFEEVMLRVGSNFQTACLDCCGTLLNFEHRRPMLDALSTVKTEKEKDPIWEAFSQQCDKDTPYPNVFAFAIALLYGSKQNGIWVKMPHKQRNLVILTGRPESVREKTYKSIEGEGISRTNYQFLCRAGIDKSPAKEFKLSKLEEYRLLPYISVYVDDDTDVLDALHSDYPNILLIKAKLGELSIYGE